MYNHTSFKQGTCVWVFIFLFQRGTVPAVVPELILALMDPNLDPLDGGRRDVRVHTTQAVLSGGQVGERLTDRVGVQLRFVGRYI